MIFPPPPYRSARLKVGPFIANLPERIAAARRTKRRLAENCEVHSEVTEEEATP
jgi:hypothetical protein